MGKSESESKLYQSPLSPPNLVVYLWLFLWF